jgi:hypothetical protein
MSFIQKHSIINRTLAIAHRLTKHPEFTIIQLLSTDEDRLHRANKDTKELDGLTITSLRELINRNVLRKN